MRSTDLIRHSGVCCWHRFLCLLAITAAATVTATAVTQEIGPGSGALVIVGGGRQDPAILERFFALAGGYETPIVVIPTAGGAAHYDDHWLGLEPFRAAGWTRIKLLHTSDRQEADSEEFSQPLREARGVWLTGGRQWRLADAYLDTRVEEELWNVLQRGGVIGGSSAGAMIQGSYLARGDTSSNTIMMGDHKEGFGFVRGVAIDQHLLRRNRQFDLLEIVAAHPQLLGIGVDEDTAIIVQGDAFEVIGQSYVAIYDHGQQLDSGGRFYLLAPGDVFDLRTRTAQRLTMTPLERVIHKPWGQR